MKSQTASTKASTDGQRARMIEEISEIANRNPSDVSLSLEANSIWSGNGKTSNATVGPWVLTEKRADSPFRLEFNSWTELESATPDVAIGYRVRPIEVSLAALCASVNWSVCMNSALDGIQFESLEIRVRANVNPQLLYSDYTDDQLAESTISVEIDLHVVGNTDQQQLNAIRTMAQRAPFMAMVMNDVRITTIVH